VRVYIDTVAGLSFIWRSCCSDMIFEVKYVLQTVLKPLVLMCVCCTSFGGGGVGEPIMKMPHSRTGALMKSKICLPGRSPFLVILAIENGIFQFKCGPRVCGRALSKIGVSLDANFDIFRGVVLNRIFKV